ncbi:hypothetical protein SAMN05660282_01130 [Corynebacterium spheniscorum]|uniref:Uncharacterized protein n=1 Tax=Corynebacterium spheniscorum TaxID=185761 RepID=A0A1I2SGE6_9CORY|nr:hypothetical protein SAMN05660282_01130 [Corynebacterium spheniscorum]
MEYGLFVMNAPFREIKKSRSEYNSLRQITVKVALLIGGPVSVTSTCA